MLHPSHGEELDLDAMLALDEAGDPGVRRVLTDAGHTVGRALADLCTTLNPSMVVVGGALGASPSVVQGIRAAIDRYAQPDAASSVEVVPGEFGERAELMGAVAMAVSRAAEAAVTITHQP
jgi:predicted NBD/HSP70 family sugar kinase